MLQKINFQDSNARRVSSLKDRQNQTESQNSSFRSGVDVKKSKDEEEKRKKSKIELDEETGEERLRNLKILEGIVGRSEGDNDKSKKFFRDPSKMRFDPRSENSSQFFEKEKEVSEEEHDGDYDDAEQEREEEPENKEVRVVKPPEGDKNYWVSNSLSQAFSGTKSSAPAETTGKKSFSFGFSGKEAASSNGFSLLSKFGKASDAENETQSSFGQRNRQSFQDKNPFKYELSDNEEEEENPNLISIDPMDRFAQKLKEKASASKGVSESFFFRSDDLRLDEGFYFFQPTTSVDEMRSKHEEQRPLLAQIMKKKLRRKAKKLEKMSFDLKGVNRKGGIVKKKFGFAKKGNFNRR